MTFGGSKLSCSDSFSPQWGFSCDKSQLVGDFYSWGCSTIFRGSLVRVGGYLGQQAVSVII